MTRARMTKIAGAAAATAAAVASGLAAGAGAASGSVRAAHSGSRGGGGPVAVIARRRPGCGSSCRQLGGVGGDEGLCLQNAALSATGQTADSRVLTMKIDGSFPAEGDLLVAAVVSRNGVAPPAGWSAVAGADHASATMRLQVFYKVAAKREPGSYAFTASAPQSISGELLDVMGVSDSDPIGAAAGQVNPSSTSVPAPSITPSSPDSLLVYVGAAQARVRWTLPQGMKVPLAGQPNASPAQLGIATQRWHPTADTGSRTATISSSTQSVGDLIALHYPEPVTCPKVKLLTRHFQPNRQAILLVRMKCEWTARCRGAFEGVDLEDHFRTAPKIAASDFSIPAGATRTVPIAVMRRGLKALKMHHRLGFDMFIWVFTSAGQPVVAGSGRSTIIAPAR